MSNEQNLTRNEQKVTVTSNEQKVTSNEREVSPQEKTDNPSMLIYVNRIENRITFQINAWQYLKLKTPETMKLHLQALKVR